MLTGERRQVSGRRGMTVLGKIPAVPKPINLPSQRLENGGLDPNVELVPRGSVSWGGAGRSPPTASSPWGNAAQSTSPASSGSWGVGPPRPLTAGGHIGSSTPNATSGTGGSGAWGSNALRPSSAGSGRPSSAGSGTRPSSAGSLRQTQDNVPVTNAWGPAAARPSSASGVLGQSQPAPPAARPRSAETKALGLQGPALTRFAEQSGGSAAPSPNAWGASRKTGEEPHQPSRFTLTRVDFPTLGSEKNPDLRPQQNKNGTNPDRAAPVDERSASAEDRPPPGPTAPYDADEMPPASGGTYGGQERMSEGWRRDGRSYNSGMTEGNWHRDGPPPMPPYGQSQGPDTWRRDPGHGAAPGGGPSDDNWRRGGPPVGPYGPPGPGRFQPQQGGFMHQQRYGPGPGSGPYGGRGGGDAGPPGGYNRHGDMYANSSFGGRPGSGAPPHRGPPMGGMYQGPVPYDYYGPPGPGYANMDEREMMMLGMNGPPGMYGNYSHGPPVDGFNRYPHAGPPSGPRHMNNFVSSRDRGDSMGYDGEVYRDGPKYKENTNFKDGAGFKDGSSIARDGREGFSEVSRDGLTSEDKETESYFQDSGVTFSQSGAGTLGSTGSRDGPRPSSRGSHLGSLRDWGAAASNDEPMDFSKPVFEDEVTSASPTVGTNKKGLSGMEGDDIQGQDNVANSNTQEAIGQARENASTEKVINRETLILEPKEASKNEYVPARKTRDGETWERSKRIGDDHTSHSDMRNQADRRMPSSEGMDHSERRWFRDGRASGHARERNFGRDPAFSSHGRMMGGRKDASAASAASLTGRTSSQHTSDSFNSRTKSANILAGSVQSPVTQSALTEEMTPSALHEKPITSSLASNPTSPSSSDGQTNDKLRILKRAGDGATESPHSDSVHLVEESSHADILVITNASELVGKDDLKVRGKPVSAHDGEKEWRPKVSNHPDLATDTVQSPSTNARQSVRASSVEDKNDVDVATGDSYDYEAQRAKMKEIAAQRALQLRREEDERIKEQKAKANAKLEELNKRSTVPLSEPSVEPASVEVIAETVQVEVQQGDTQVEIVKEEVVSVESSSSGAVPRGGRNGRNEHGKRERVGDRKSTGRSRDEHRAKMGPAERREMTKGRLTPTSSQSKMEPQVPSTTARVGTPPQAPLPPPSAAQPESVAGTIESGPLGTHVQPVVPKPQEARPRGRHAGAQVKHGTKQLQPSVDGEQPSHTQENAVDSAGRNGVWPVGTASSRDIEPREVGTFIMGSSGVTPDTGVTGARKKKTKNSTRHKHKVEGPSVTSDYPAVAEQGQIFDLSSSNDSGNEAGKPTPKAAKITTGDDAVKVIPSAATSKEALPTESKFEVATPAQQAPVAESSGVEAMTFRSNGDVANRSRQRKSQTGRRVPTREKAASQDVRVGDKAHGPAEGMIWAPVKSAAGAHPAASKGPVSTESGTPVVEKKEEPTVPPPTGRARRAELERYTPKPVVKQQAQQQEELQQQQQLQSSAPVSRSQGADATDSSASEMHQAPTPVTEVKPSSEARQVENTGKQGRSHTSWRQRGSGGERPSVGRESHHLQQSESVETAGRPQQHGSSGQGQHNHHRSKAPNSDQSRPGSAQYSRSENVGRRLQTQAVEEKEQLNQDSQPSRTAQSSAQAAAGAMASDKESKPSQEIVTPYQAPRPGSGQKNRGAESDGQSSVEHGRSHRSNISHADKQQGMGSKYDRDQHNAQERGSGHHPHPRSNAYRHQGSSGSYDRDSSHGHSGSHQQSRHVSHTQSNNSEIASNSRDKEQKSSSTYAGTQNKGPVPPAQGQAAAVEREQNVSDQGTHQQRRSPGRHRPRQQAVSHERDQPPASAPHSHQHSRYRQSERDHQRDVSNAGQSGQQKGGFESQWQQSGSNSTEQGRPRGDQSRSNDSSMRSMSQKSQPTNPGGGERDHHHSTNRSDSFGNRSQASYTSDNHKHTPSESGSHHQKSHQHHQGASHGASKGEAAQSGSSHANGERTGSPPPFRSRDAGHSRRGRLSGRFGGTGPGRSGEMEGKRPQPVNQRVPVDTAGSAVPG